MSLPTAISRELHLNFIAKHDILGIKNKCSASDFEHTNFGTTESVFRRSNSAVASKNCRPRMEGPSNVSC